MPVNQRVDKYGYYFQYGEHGFKYYYCPMNRASKEQALLASKRQGRAINVSERKRKTMSYNI